MISLLFGLMTFAQLDKYYSVKRSEAFDTVDFYLKATATNCEIKRSEAAEEVINIFGNPNLDKINPRFGTKITSNTCFAKLILDEYGSTGFGSSFSMAFTRSDKENDLWKVDFSDDKIYNLNLFYGLGNADINLTGMPVKTLKIKSGSADIAVGYDEHNYNPVQMDTFFIKADFGTIVANHMELTRARHVITKIGFGNVLLDFDRVTDQKCDIRASIGAGNLEVMLPRKGIPVIIHLRDSPLCGIKMAEGFEEVEKNVFVNMDYAAHAENLLTFNLDVALGMVRFEYAD